MVENRTLALRLAGRSRRWDGHNERLHVPALNSYDGSSVQIVLWVGRGEGLGFARHHGDVVVAPQHRQDFVGAPRGANAGMHLESETFCGIVKPYLDGTRVRICR